MANEGPSEEEEQQLRVLARELAEAVEDALPRFVQRAVDSRSDAVADDVVRSAGDRARAEVGGAVRALLERDIDEQRTNPLALLRGAVRYPTEVLATAGVPPVRRDRDAERLFPDDPYDLTPGSFADVDPSLHEPGLRWGAAKAYVHLARRRRGSARD